MGKEERLQGLFTQQRDLVGNNNKVCYHSPKKEPSPPPSCSRMPSSEHHNHAPPSRHSPPASPSSQHIPLLEGLGSLEEVWSMGKQWDRFKQYLATTSEGEDSEGKPLSMERYAIFLELYALLDKEYREGGDKARLVEMVNEIAEHEEEFMGRERCLRCVDSGARREVLANIKSVKAGKAEAGPSVFILIYPKIVDKLGELLGNYQNMLLEQQQGKVKNR